MVAQEFYVWSFDFARDAGRKNLSLEPASELWGLVLQNRYPLVAQWLQVGQCPRAVRPRDATLIVRFGLLYGAGAFHNTHSHRTPNRPSMAL